MLFTIYWYDPVIFVLHFSYVSYYIYCFVNIVPSLHPWDEYHLIMCIIFLMYSWIQIANILVKISACMFIRDIDL